ncbi:type IV secretory system conjugative DNA transfer family protein [Streptococcus infantarius]|uniref:type IV secretory system conjugative DNA transfer family protein n=1 Tax=Streptococcus infantarius TaxID=102684 RepID=UPI0022E329E3|nr:TraM recognition domain-containing protein [Streptococcus infantarius]
MKKYSLFLSIFSFGMILSPLVALLLLLVFLIYRFIIRSFWCDDSLLIKISFIVGIFYLFLGYFITGLPHIVQIFLGAFRSLLNFNKGGSLENIPLNYWLFSLFDFWGWSISSFGFSGLVYASKDHREVMIKRETDRLADRFSDDYSPDYLDEKHQLVLGTTGAGKTSYINQMAKVTAGRTDKDSDLLIIIDGKGDIGDFSLLDNATQIAQDVGRELVILNGTNNPVFDGRTYNPFIGCSVTQAKDLIMSLLDDDSIKKSSGSEHYKTMFEAYLLSVLEMMEILGISFSFSNILDCLNFDRIQTEFLYLRDEKLEPERFNYFSVLYSELERNWEDSKASVTKLEIFKRGRGKAIFEGGSSKSWFNVSTIFENNQILIVLIDEMSMPEYSQGLAKMVVQDVRNFTASRLNGQHKRGRQVRLVLDEFSAYANKTMLALLSRARSAGVTVYLSTQSMGDLSALGDDFQQAVIENINRFVIFRQNSPKSAEMVADIVGTRQTVTQTERTTSGLATNEASNTLAREYLINPDEIKALPAQTAFYIAKDESKVYRFVNDWAKKPVQKTIWDKIKKK